FYITANNLTVFGTSTATNGALTKIGAGTLTLSGANSDAGATTDLATMVQACTASVANTSGAFGNNSAVTLANTAGVTLDITGFKIGRASCRERVEIGGNVTLGAENLTKGGWNTRPEPQAGVIYGTGGLINIGMHTQAL